MWNLEVEGWFAVEWGEDANVASSLVEMVEDFGYFLFLTYWCGHCRGIASAEDMGVAFGCVKPHGDSVEKFIFGRI